MKRPSDRAAVMDMHGQRLVEAILRAESRGVSRAFSAGFLTVAISMICFALGGLCGTLAKEAGEKPLVQARGAGSTDEVPVDPTVLAPQPGAPKPFIRPEQAKPYLGNSTVQLPPDQTVQIPEPAK